MVKQWEGPSSLSLCVSAFNFFCQQRAYAIDVYMCSTVPILRQGALQVHESMDPSIKDQASLAWVVEEDLLSNP